MTCQFARSMDAHDWLKRADVMSTRRYLATKTGSAEALLQTVDTRISGQGIHCGLGRRQTVSVGAPMRSVSAARQSARSQHLPWWITLSPCSPQTTLVSGNTAITKAFAATVMRPRQRKT